MNDAGYGSDLEKAPAAVSVKVVRKAAPKQGERNDAPSGGDAPTTKGRTTPRSRSRSRGKVEKKDKGSGANLPGNIRQHVCGTFVGDKNGREVGKELSKTCYKVYRRCWKKVVDIIDDTVNTFIDPVCEETKQAARHIEKQYAIPQFVPVVFHDAVGLSYVDYTEFFDATIGHLRDDGYVVVHLTQQDMHSLRKLGIWSALYSLVSDQNVDALRHLSAEFPSRALSSTSAYRALQNLQRHTGRRIVLAVENIKALDHGTWGEVMLALSEAWDCLPSMLLAGQIVKEDVVSSNSRTLSKLNPVSVPVPAAFCILDEVMRRLVSEPLRHYPFPMPGTTLGRLCDLLTDQHCSVQALKGFFKFAFLQHFMMDPLCVHYAENREAAMKEHAKELQNHVGKQTTPKAGPKIIQSKLSECEGKVRGFLQDYLTAVEVAHVASSVMPASRRPSYIGCLKGAAHVLSAKDKQMRWREGSVFSTLTEAIRKGGGDQLDHLLDQWKKTLEDGQGGAAVSEFAGGLLKQLESISNLGTEKEAVPTSVRDTNSKASTSPKQVENAASKRMSRRQALQQHVSSLAQKHGIAPEPRGGGQRSGSGIAMQRAACANFIVSMWESLCRAQVAVNSGSNQSFLVGPCEHENTGNALNPSVPSNVIHSLKHPKQILKYHGDGGANKDMEDVCLVYHFVQGFSSSTPMDEIFDQFCGIYAGEDSNRMKGRGRKRKTATRDADSNIDKETLNVRFERAVQELSVCGLIKVHRRKLNKFVSLTFT
mmetsp:Transcript_15212/g.38662  ORF Transcript_15212/g.38662 Transcript_15212/m.38662 type:complete len:764 (-) Transcript_15212:118-2409(-)